MNKYFSGDKNNEHMEDIATIILIIAIGAILFSF